MIETGNSLSGLRHRSVHTIGELAQAGADDAISVDAIIDAARANQTALLQAKNDEQKWQTLKAGLDPRQRAIAESGGPTRIDATEDVGWSQTENLPAALKELGINRIYYFASRDLLNAYPSMGHHYNLSAEAMTADNKRLFSFHERMNDGKITQIFNVEQPDDDTSPLQEQQFVVSAIPADEKWKVTEAPIDAGPWPNAMAKWHVQHPMASAVQTGERRTRLESVDHSQYQNGYGWAPEEMNLPVDMGRLSPAGLSFLNTVMSPEGAGFKGWLDDQPRDLQPPAAVILGGDQYFSDVVPQRAEGEPEWGDPDATNTRQVAADIGRLASTGHGAEADYDLRLKISFLRDLHQL